MEIHRASLGFPAISVPCGFTGDNLPVGLQLTTRKMDETTAVRIAAAYERVTDWHERLPPVLNGPSATT